MPDENSPIPPASLPAGLDPADLFARGLKTVQMTTGAGGLWQPPSVAEAARLFPQFEILRLLGRGGMGAVYQGRQLALDRFVAIKLLPLEVSMNQDFADRFTREARTMGKLSHPNIIAVYEFGQTSEGHWFFVMEYVEGTNLHELIHGPGLAPVQALAILGGVCDALAYAHGKGVVHRDIKPANVMIDAEGRVKVADFGLARLTDTSATQLGHTMTGTVMGTPDYMAPEQMRAMNVDHRADIYSCGVMLYEALCKEVPRGVFDPPSQRVRVDARVDQVVAKALAQQPERRFQSTQEMKAALEQIGAPPAPVTPAASSPVAKKSPALLYGGLAAAVLALSGAAFFFLGGKTKRVAATPRPVVRATPTPQPIVRAATPEPAPIAAATPVPSTPAPAPVAPANPLPEDVQTFAGHRYRFVPFSSAWTRASKQVEEHGGHLAVITSAEENEWIRATYIARLAPGEFLWIGAHHPEDAWRWVNGEPFGFTDWWPEAKLNQKNGAAGFLRGAKQPERSGWFTWAALRGTSDVLDFNRGYLVEWPDDPRPAAPPAPAPPVVKAETPTGKWLAEQDAKWQADHRRDVAAPFEKGTGDLRAQYLAAIDRFLTAASNAGKLDEAVFLRDERVRFERDSAIPAEDEAQCPAALKTTRANYRTQFAKLDTERITRAKAAFAKIEPVLTQNIAALTQRQRLDEALELKTRRDELAAAWLPAVVETPAKPAATAATPAPLGAKLAPPARGPKLRTREAVEKLFALGAEVYLDSWHEADRITAPAQVKSEKQTIHRIHFGAAARGGAPLAEEDFAILDSLPDLHRVTFTGQLNLTDTALARLRAAKDLEQLHIIGRASLTPAGYAVLPGFSGLKLLSLSGQVGCDDEAMAQVGGCKALANLFLTGLPITDAGFAHVGKLTNLVRLEATNLAQLTGPGFAALLGAKNLQDYVHEGPAPAELLTHLAKHRSLSTIQVLRSTLSDADLAPLSAMPSLQSFSCYGSGAVSGAAFAAWPVRNNITELHLGETAGQDDATLRAIAAAFPKLTSFSFKPAAGLTPAGIAALGRLRGLSGLQAIPGGIDDTLVAEIAKLDRLTVLHLNNATLTAPGIAALGKLASLRTLYFDNPPVDDESLKAFAKLKSLRLLRIGNQQSKEKIPQLKAALPDCSVTP